MMRTTHADGWKAKSCNKRPGGGQWARVAALALALLATPAAEARAGGAGTTAPAGPSARSTPSGLPVPRYVSTRFETVNARSGPGDDYRLVWTYHVKGLPLQIIAETDDWRRVCDPDGGVAWVHRRTVGDARRVMRVDARPIEMRAHPAETARVTALLAGRSIAALQKCDKGWCRIAADRAAGWVPEGELWGAVDAPQCRPGER